MATSVKTPSLAQRRAEQKLAEAMIGLRVVKDFGLHGRFRGVVYGITNIPDQRPLYRVRYEGTKATALTHPTRHRT